MDISLDTIRLKLEDYNASEYACQELCDAIVVLENAIATQAALTSEDFGKPFDYYRDN